MPRRRPRDLIMTDGDGSFKGDLFNDYCEETGIDLFKWVSNSADLAPIENLWGEGDRRLRSVVQETKKWRVGAKENKDNLAAWEATVLQTFKGIPKSFPTNTVDGMSARVAEMVRRKGKRVAK